VDGRAAEADASNTKVLSSPKICTCTLVRGRAVSKCHSSRFIGGVGRRGFEASSQNKVFGPWRSLRVERGKLTYSRWSRVGKIGSLDDSDTVHGVKSYRLTAAVQRT